MNWYKAIKVADSPVFDAYHGTSNTTSFDSNGFDYAYLGNGNESYGPGFYFTDNMEIAQTYAGDSKTSGIIKAKVNLTNPVIIDGSTMSIFEQMPSIDVSQIRRIVEESIQTFGDEALYDWGDPEFEGTESIMQQIVQSYKNSPFTTLVYDFFSQNLKAGLEAVHREIGHDGVIVNFADGTRFFVAWFPHQIETRPTK